MFSENTSTSTMKDLVRDYSNHLAIFIAGLGLYFGIKVDMRSEINETSKRWEVTQEASQKLLRSTQEASQKLLRVKSRIK